MDRRLIVESGAARRVVVESDLTRIVRVGVATPADIGAVSMLEKGVAGGVATLGPDGKLPASQSPDALHITDSGRIGIGTKHPASIFEVKVPNVGNYPRIDAPAGVDPILRFAVDGVYKGQIGFKNDSNTFGIFHPTNSASPILAAVASGRVGINTVAPTYTLHVVGDGRFTSHLWTEGALLVSKYAQLGEQLIINSDTATVSFRASNAIRFQLRNIDSAKTLYGQVYNDEGAFVNNFMTVDRTNGDTTLGYNHAVRIKSNGRIGVGVTSPIATLDIRGAASDPFRLERTNYDAYTFRFDAGGGMALHNDTDNRTELRFTGTGDVLLAESGTGNVGIGTTAPTAKLHVFGNARVDGGLTFGGTNTALLNIVPSVDSFATLDFGFGSGLTTGGGWFRVNRYTNTTGQSGIQVLRANGTSDVNAQISNSTTYFCTSAGNVGIGTTAPTNKLHVVGNTLITGILTATKGYFSATTAALDVESSASTGGFVWQRLQRSGQDKWWMMSYAETDNLIFAKRVGSALSVLTLTQDGHVIPNLPKSDPAVAGALWNDNGTVKVSAG